MHIGNIPPWFNFGAACAVPCVAVWRGDWRERTMAGFLVAVHLNGQIHFAPALFDAPTHLIGLALGVACVFGSRSYWVIWATAALLIDLTVDTLFAVHAVSGRWAHSSAELVCWYAVAIAVVYGSLRRQTDLPGPYRLAGALQSSSLAAAMQRLSA